MVGKRTLSTSLSKEESKTTKFYKIPSVTSKCENSSTNFKNNPTPTKLSFSSRNSLRTAQSFANHSNKMQQLPFVIPRYMDCDSNYDESLNTIRWLLDRDYRSMNGIGNRRRHYSRLASDHFVSLGNIMVCLLCNIEQKSRGPKTISRHLASEQHNQLYNKLRFTLTDMTPHPLSLQMRSIDKLLKQWYDNQHLELNDIQDRLLIAQAFTQFVKSIDSTCECRLVGSFLSGTPLRNSNLDLELVHPNSRIFLDDPRSKNSIHHRLVDPQADYGLQINLHTLYYDLVPNAVTTLYDIMKSVKTNPNCDYILQSHPRDLMCKVPKLTVKHKASNISIDLICYSESSCKQAVLLNTYLSLDNRARVLALLVKHWAKICKIDNPNQGTLSPGIFLILLIYYLQRVSPPVLPCLHEALNVNDKKNRVEESCNLLDQLDINAVNHMPKNEVLPTEDNIQKVLSPSQTKKLTENFEDFSDEEEEEDSTCYNPNSEEITKLNWSSENESSVCTLFVDFLKTMIKEFDNLSTVISIRTLATVGLQEKDWTTQVKAIEDPIKPRVNMSRCIGTVRTFEYIKRCFRHGYYYLISMPFDENFYPKTEIQADPRDFIELYVHTRRLERFFAGRREILKAGCTAREPYQFMLQWGLFATDVEANNAIFDTIDTSLNNCDELLRQLPSKVASYYQENLLVPKDIVATTFCWLCRKNGHSRNTCPKLTINRLTEVAYSFKSELDTIANFDDIFTHFYKEHSITKRLADQHELVLTELTDLINTQTSMRCQLQPFGSTVNDLGSYYSDLDICMTLENNLTGKGVECVQVLQVVSNLLSKNAEVKRLEPILSARVPIIRFEYKGFDVDLSMYNQCAIYNSKLLKTYASLDGRVAKLFYLVKRFAKVSRVASSTLSRQSLKNDCLTLTLPSPVR